LGEHQLDKLGVTGSSPVPPTPAIALQERLCGAEGMSAVRGALIVFEEAAAAVAAA
jgi:hypothetical protein